MEALLGYLHQLYCPPEAPAEKRKNKLVKERQTP
jgi:hypothetical protein